MSDKQLSKLLTVFFCILLGAVFAFLSAKYLLPLFSPFILAFVTSAAIDPGVRYFEKRLHVKRWPVSGLLTILLFVGVFFICKAIVINITGAVTELVKTLPATIKSISDSLSWLNEKIYSYINSAPHGARDYLKNAVDNISLKISDLPAELSGTALKYVTGLAAHMPSILLFTVTYAVGTVFISSRFPEVKGFILRQIPEKHRSRVSALKTGVLSALVKWLRAQLILMTVTFTELTAGLVFLRIPHPVLIAALTALIDALPVLGVGTVLLPWAVFQLITGNTALALGLVILYGVITLIRSLLEPKLISGQLGLHPVATLIAIYTGFSSIGVAGMLLFPAALIVLKKLNGEGLLKLWK